MAWWQPNRFAKKAPYLRARGAILASVRAFFSAQGFVEVDTPALQVSPGLEPHLRAFGTLFHEPGGPKKPMFLHTSPEFAMKKLLAAGVPKLFQLAHVFRDGERAATHSPEFTLLEWYRAEADYHSLFDDCEALLKSVLAACKADTFTWKGLRSDPRAKWEKLSVADAFERHCGIDLLTTAPDPENPSLDRLARAAAQIGIAPHKGDSWEDLFFRIFLERIEPKLGVGAPTILYDYPIAMAALARAKPDDQRVAERCELYVAGLELANGFSELTDEAEQRRRFERDREAKRARGEEPYPVDEDFLRALEAMPQAAGMALGFDRLVMLATGAPRIDDVLWAPVD